MPIGALELFIILVIVVVLFGGGRISNIMGELGSGIASFRKGIREGQSAEDKNKLDDGK
jgi:sec-independent protein translocase protein TatA